jgi:DNA-binding response OmpR family regulator
MSDETGRRAGSKNIREPLFAATGAFGQDTAELYEFGPFRLEPAERKLWRRNEVVVLTPKAFDTLVLLVRNSGHLLEKDKLIKLRCSAKVTHLCSFKVIHPINRIQNRDLK